ncbi:MAG: hypothetical protein WAV82_07310 [Methylobacter sp.]
MKTNTRYQKYAISERCNFGVHSLVGSGSTELPDIEEIMEERGVNKAAIDKINVGKKIPIVVHQA